MTSARRFATTVPKLGRAKRQKVRNLRAVRGIPAWVDSAPITAHIVWLHSIGFSEFALATAAGVSQQGVYQIRTGMYEKARIDHASRLRAVTHIPVPAQRGTLVPSVGTVRRLRALHAAGFSYVTLASELGYTKAMVAKWASSSQVRQETWQLIADLYERLSGSVGDSPAARARGLRSNWPLPLEWDGFDIDDPRVDPPRARRGSATARSDLTVGERRAEAQRLTDLGLSAAVIAARLGIGARQVTRYRATIRDQKESA